MHEALALWMGFSLRLQMQPSTSDDNAALLRPVTDLAVTTLLDSRDSAHAADKKEISKDFHKRLVTRVRSDTNSRIKALKSGGTLTHHIKLLPADWRIQNTAALQGAVGIVNGILAETANATEHMSDDNAALQRPVTDLVVTTLLDSMVRPCG